VTGAESGDYSVYNMSRPTTKKKSLLIYLRIKKGSIFFQPVIFTRRKKIHLKIFTRRKYFFFNLSNKDISLAVKYNRNKHF